MKTKLILAAAAALLTTTAHADYPDRPIRIIVPFTPGGSTDILARMMGQKLTEAWGQQVVVENRPGANGVVGAEITARANPDGHSLLMVAIGHAVNPALQKKLPYDTEKDFQPISLTAILPLMFTVHPGLKANNIQELIALAKSRTVTYGSGGVGSSQHLAGELFNSMARIKMNHIPYKGGNQGLQDVIGGQIDMMPQTILSAGPHIKSGRLRAIAVTTAKRNPAWPDIPTVAESGLKGYESIAWYGLVGPAKLPPAVLSKLAAETAKATRSPDVQAALTKQGAEPVGSSPREFAQFIRSEMTKYSKVIREAGVKPE
ncbi:MAG TPA: tripartite tricarboxylate transporter substrate binding protein [Burkholderiales bacterium]|nr:tripartite tricarboxylate transporter substrate binding protein [Burkholderiales bacterium]